MSEAGLLAEVTEAKAKVKRLRERMSIGTPPVHKDLSLITLVPKWSDSNSLFPFDEFFSSTMKVNKTYLYVHITTTS